MIKKLQIWDSIEGGIANNYLNCDTINIQETQKCKNFSIWSEKKKFI